MLSLEMYARHMVRFHEEQSAERDARVNRAAEELVKTATARADARCDALQAELAALREEGELVIEHGDFRDYAVGWLIQRADAVRSTNAQAAELIEHLAEGVRVLAEENRAAPKGDTP